MRLIVLLLTIFCFSFNVLSAQAEDNSPILSDTAAWNQEFLDLENSFKSDENLFSFFNLENGKNSTKQQHKYWKLPIKKGLSKKQYKGHYLLQKEVDNSRVLSMPIAPIEKNVEYYLQIRKY